eukprot:2762912-Heterocapsa_arctica.AAC.1
MTRPRTRKRTGSSHYCGSRLRRKPRSSGPVSQGKRRSYATRASRPKVWPRGRPTFSPRPWKKSR